MAQVSEELNSVETHKRRPRYQLYKKFQKNLIVWKRSRERDREMAKSRFRRT